jgi:hypothetical protein
MRSVEKLRTKTRTGKKKTVRRGICLTNSRPVFDPIEDDLRIARREAGSRTSAMQIYLPHN